MNEDRLLLRRMRGNRERMAAYGFRKDENGNLCFVFPLGHGVFEARITVGADLRIFSEVNDAETGDPYIALRAAGPKGAYAAMIREEYMAKLQEIAEACFNQVRYAYDQSERIAAVLASEGYGDESRDARIVSDEETGMEFLEIRMKQGGSSRYETVRHGRTVYQRIPLDDTYTDTQIAGSIPVQTHAGRREGERKDWIIPANPKYFDLDHGFSVSKQLYWKQSFDAQEGDLVYIYYGMPFGSIRYKCIVTECNLPYKGRHDEPMKIDQMCRLKCIAMYKDGKIDRKRLKELGITNIRGARYMTQPLREEISKLYPGEEENDE